ncbi:uncharacterized protein LODBEIA_P29050 [Lodderomyces beijingensis]|uniref:Autophagy-related protein 17 n=1 Tax=Lodderomyces beijingensis TaxID=1775926 RepID=A0ABP0ZKK9_9ASCO
MSYTVDQVSQWLNESASTLENAQKLCTKAQELLHVTYHQMAELLPDEVDTTVFMFDSYQRQFESLNKIVLSVRENLRIKVDKAVTKIDSVLKSQLEELNKVIKQLSNTEVPSFLQTDEIESKRLIDFVAIEQTVLLQQNIDIYKLNCQKIRNLLNKHFQSELQDRYSAFQKSHGPIVKGYEGLDPVRFELKSAQGNLLESKGQIGVILRENQSLEKELVSMLQMFTNHYDQCTKAVELLSTETSGITVNLEVLEVDAQELGDVFKELKAVCDIIERNATRSEKLYSNYCSYVDNSISHMKEELNKFRDFKTRSVPQFLALESRCQEVIKTSSIADAELQNLPPCEIYAETVKQLTSHYRQFLEIYKTNYLTELHHEQFLYPKKFLKRVGEFLNEDLYRMQLDETAHRKKWLSKYGDFIPKEWKLPGEQELPMVVQVVTEGLEHIQSTEGVEGFNEGEEKKLLALMRGLRDTTNPQ